METSARSDSHFRIRCGECVKYVIVAPGALDNDELLIPLNCLPLLPYNKDKWYIARNHGYLGTQNYTYHWSFAPYVGYLRVSTLTY